MKCATGVERIVAFLQDFFLVSIALFIILSSLLFLVTTDNQISEAAPFILLNLIFFPFYLLVQLWEYPQVYENESWILPIMVAMVLLESLCYTKMERTNGLSTFGKKGQGLTIQRLNGTTVSFSRIYVRNLLKVVTRILFGLPFLLQLWTKNRQALHDVLTDMVVVKKTRFK